MSQINNNLLYIKTGMIDGLTNSNLRRLEAILRILTTQEVVIFRPQTDESY